MRRRSALRIAGIAAREADGSCRSNQPCPKATAIQARDALVEVIGSRRGVSREGHVLVNGPTMMCRSKGNAGGSRTAAWCTSPKSGDVSCAMVRTRTVLSWAEQPLSLWHIVEQRCRTGVVADLARRHEEAQRAAVRIGDGMELGVHAAFGAADQAAEVPFFTRRLDAVRCALR